MLKSSRRLFFFVKKHGFWITTDRMQRDKPRLYTQQRWLPLRDNQEPKVFLADDIVKDEKAQFIKAHTANTANLSMYRIGPVSLTSTGATSAGPLSYEKSGIAESELTTSKWTGPRSDRGHEASYYRVRQPGRAVPGATAHHGVVSAQYSG